MTVREDMIKRLTDVLNQWEVSPVLSADMATAAVDALGVVEMLNDFEWIAAGPLADELTPGHLRCLTLEDRHDMMMHRARAAIARATETGENG